MKRRLLYLVNPISGIKKKPLLKAAIEKKTTAAGLEYIIADTRADGNYSFLHQQIIDDNITDVIICGGDGSVSTITSYLLNTNVAIGIVPMGSGNGLAFAAGIPISTSKALDIIFKGNSSYIDGFFINGKFSCMMCGIGNDAQVAHDFAKAKKRGLNTYLRLSAVNYFRSKPYTFTVNVDDYENKKSAQSGGSPPLKKGVARSAGGFSVDAFFIVIANSNQFGNHVTIAPKASLSDGLLDIVIVRKMNKLVLPFALLQQITGFNISANKKIINFQTPELTIINKGGAPIHIDGEPEPSAENIIIKIKPNAFRLLQP
jgi:diacylglycerol kinase (ATP)